MAVNYLYQKPAGDNAAEIASLEVELKSLHAELLKGKVLIQVNSGDVGSSSLIEVPIKERIAIVMARLYALDPTNYPQNVAFRTTRTRAVISQS